MVKRTRRKNKSKKRTNRKRTTHKRTTRRLRGGGPADLPWCSSCGQGGDHKGLTKDLTKPEAVYKCKSCGFNLTNYIAINYITQTLRLVGKPSEVEFDPITGFKLKTTSLETLKTKYRQIVSSFNDACNQTYTVEQIKLMGNEGINILEKIRKVAIVYEFFSVDDEFNETKKLLQWLPLKESDFYKSTVSQVASSVAKTISAAFG